MKKILAVCALVISSFYLQGCVSSATTANMINSQSLYSGNNGLTQKISVTTVEVDNTPLLASQIGPNELESALKASLKASNLLAPSQGMYILNSKLVGLNQPAFGLDMTVTAHIKYELKDAASKASLMDKIISASYTATVSDAFVGVKRLKIANEGAIRNNFAELIKELSELR